MKDKRPVVYVARTITGYENYSERLIANFVAKAYLIGMEKWWDPDGRTGETYYVEFCDQCFSWGEWVDADLTAEYPESRKDRVFKDYISCKKYVDKINKDNVEYKLKSETDKSRRREIVSIYKTAIAFGKVLEEKYIPLEERQQLDENINKI